MEKEIAKAQVPFHFLTDFVMAFGFFLTAMMPQQHQRLTILAVVLLLVTGIRSSTRFRWLLMRIGQFLRMI